MRPQQLGWKCVVLCLGLSLSAIGCAKKSPNLAPPPPVETSPPPAPPAPPRPASSPMSDADRFRSMSLDELQARLNDVYFDYDRSELRPESQQALAASAAWLKESYNTAVIEVEGHADERGTPEYNLGLGERRANSTMSYLLASGVPGARITYVSYGKERPQCRQAIETCWSKNRRAHLRIVSK